ncbi:MAG: TIGR02147 family protein [Bdellovibrionales bacterium]
MLVEKLKQTFEERCRKNPSYSLRAFARSLDMDSSTLSAIMRGKRPITVKTARKILEGLHITNPHEAQTLMLQTVTGEEFSDQELAYKELAIESAEAISAWQHFAILALLELDGFKGYEREISTRLNISAGMVDECLHRLERLGIVMKSGRRWELTGRNMATGSEVPNSALREGHRQNISRALESLYDDPVDVRDISGITMAVCKEKLPQARKLVQDFRRRLAAFMESGKKDAVYRLNIQLFPLTKEMRK